MAFYKISSSLSEEVIRKSFQTSLLMLFSLFLNFSWTVHSPLNIPLCHHILASANDMLYLIGGMTLSNVSNKNKSSNSKVYPESVKWVLVYDEESDDWTMLEKMPEPVHDACGVTNGNVLDYKE